MQKHKLNINMLWPGKYFFMSTKTWINFMSHEKNIDLAEARPIFFIQVYVVHKGV
jgi:hypothetical protein